MLCDLMPSAKFGPTAREKLPKSIFTVQSCPTKIKEVENQTKLRISAIQSIIQFGIKLYYEVIIQII